MAVATAAAGVAGFSALAAYIDAKYHVSQDLYQLRRRKQAEKWYLENVKANRVSLWYPFCQKAQQYADDPCIWSREQTYTWQQVHDRAVQYAQYFLTKGVKPGDLVALYLTNSPDFLFIWLSLWILIVDDDEGCQERIEGSRSDIESELGMSTITLDAGLRTEINGLSTVVPDESYRESVKGTSPACLLYTSGTTGLPKAAIFPVIRIWQLGNQKKPSLGQIPGPGGDRWYVCMPMFHGTGGLTVIGCMMGGMSAAIGKRFSVSTFWEDIHDSESTFFVYVGEAARYLLNAPPSRYERDHPRLRVMYGNGLRPDVWRKFQERFDVPEVAEFFNSTEGLFQLVLHNVYVPVAIDSETKDIYRDPKSGFAKRMPYDIGGEILVAIPSENAFPGYFNDKKATTTKIVRDVFRKGDIFYRTGDALRRDNDGRWYFLDRLGDTFRWKSENISTAEVSEVLGQFPGVMEANVYGVLVPRHDGRAGCVALSLEDRDKFDFDGFLRHSREQLPKPAVPVFIRLVSSSLTTDNNKQNKVPLRDEGIDLDIVGSKVPGGQNDVFLWLDPRNEGYKPFTKHSLEAMRSGLVQL